MKELKATQRENTHILLWESCRNKLTSDSWRSFWWGSLPFQRPQDSWCISMHCLQWTLFKMYAGKTTYLNSRRKTYNIILAWKKEKPEELKSLPTISTFFSFHWYIAGSPHPAPRILLLPGLRNRNKHRCFLLTVGKRGKEWPEAAVVLLLLAWQRAVGIEPGHRATISQGLRAPAPSHRQNWGQRQGWSVPNKQKRICWLGKHWQKRCEKSWSSTYQMCWGAGRWEGNICWLPRGEDNQENQTGSYYNMGPQLKINYQQVRFFFPVTNELNPQSIISDGLSVSNKKCNGSEKPYMFGEYFYSPLESYTCLGDIWPLLPCSPSLLPSGQQLRLPLH